MPLKPTNKNRSAKRPKKEDTLVKICFRVVDHVDAMLAYWDKNEICRFANKAYLKWGEKSGDELIGKVKLKKFLRTIYTENQLHIRNVLAGKKQVFERDFHFPDGSVYPYIVTYTPDKIKGKVAGFFVHVADVNLIKELEIKLLDLEKTKRREVLRSVIETQEAEREMISYELRDKVNQTLASCKMMLDTADKSKDSKALFTTISRNIHEAIDELNRISTDLTPSVIILVGFLAGVKEYTDGFEKRYQVTIQFKCLDEKIESLAINNKISIFRIIQNYLLIISGYAACKIVNIEIMRLESKLIICLQNNLIGFKLPLYCKEFIDIEHRLEYYDGTWKELMEKNRKILFLELHVPS